MILFFSKLALCLVCATILPVVHFILIKILFTAHTVVAFVAVLVNVSFVFDSLKKIANELLMIGFRGSDPGISKNVQLQGINIQLEDDPLSLQNIVLLC